MVPHMTGKTASPGKYCVAMTAPDEMLRSPQSNPMVTSVENG